MSVSKKTVKGAARPAGTGEAEFEYAAEQAAKGYEEVAKMTREGLEQVGAFAKSNYAGIADYNKDFNDAVQTSSTAMTQSAEAATKAMTEYAKDSVAEGLSMANRLFGAKTLQDVVNVQTDWVKASLDRFKTESTNMQERSVAAASAASAPFQAGATAAFEKFSKPFAG